MAPSCHPSVPVRFSTSGDPARPAPHCGGTSVSNLHVPRNGFSGKPLTADPSVRRCVRSIRRAGGHQRSTSIDHPTRDRCRTAFPAAEQIRNLRRGKEVIGPTLTSSWHRSKPASMPTLQTDSARHSFKHADRVQPPAHLLATTMSHDASETPLATDSATGGGSGHPRLSDLLFLLGASLFTSGATLIGVSFLDSNPYLWTWGVPMALGGQGSFLLALLLQLELLWKRNHPDEGSLRKVSAVSSPWSSQSRGPERRLRVERSQETTCVPPEAVMRDLKCRLSSLGDRLSRSRA